MRQHIYPKDAMKVSKEQFYSLFNEDLVDREDWAKYHHKKVTIGKMLEFLHNSYDEVYLNFKDKKVFIELNTSSKTEFKAHGEELVEILWEAIILALNN